MNHPCTPCQNMSIKSRKEPPNLIFGKPQIFSCGTCGAVSLPVTTSQRLFLSKQTKRLSTYRRKHVLGFLISTIPAPPLPQSHYITFCLYHHPNKHRRILKILIICTRRPLRDTYLNRGNAIAIESNMGSGLKAWKLCLIPLFGP